MRVDLAGVLHELLFWRDFVRSKRFLQGWVAPVPTPELQPLVRAFLQARPDATVLDVGSGVVSLLHGTVPVDRLTAADPLSGFYELIFDYQRHRLIPPVAVAAEELEVIGAFDVVHMSNALDHVGDPRQAMERLERAVRPGGWLILQGFENEGTAQQGAGLHGWDLRLDGTRLEMSAATAGDYSLLGVADEAHVVEFTDRRWFVWMRRRPA